MIPPSLRFRSAEHGLTLIETLIAVALIGLMIPAIIAFLWGGFNLNRRAQGAMLNQQNARRIIDNIKRNLREVTTGSGNQYPLDSCEALEFVFYADIDENESVEKIRYFLSGEDFKVGITAPAGTTYPSGDEVVSTPMSGILNSGASPLFEYYNASYTGSGSALSQPVSCSEVRLVRIRFMIDMAIELAPGAFEVSSTIQLRNLKNNF